MGDEPSAAPAADELGVLKLTLADLREENERLRDARKTIASQLGPLPISAALVAGLVSGFSPSGAAHLNRVLTILALFVLLAMVAVGMVFSRRKPYRELRERAEAETGRPGDTSTCLEWHRRMVTIEYAVRGEGRRDPDREPPVAKDAGPPATLEGRGDQAPGDARSRTPNWLRPGAATLQSGLNVEWWAVFAAKVLFLIAVALLILARVYP